MGERIPETQAEPDGRDAGTRTVVDQLGRSAALHHALTASLPETAMLLLDQQMRILIAEGEGLRALPWCGDDMFKGRRVSELHGEVPEDVLATSAENYRAALDGEPREFEIASAGATFSIRAVPVRDKDGNVESALVVIRDVTRLRDVERQLVLHARQQQAVARLGQLGLRHRDLDTLIDEVVTTVAATLELELCAVWQLRPGEQALNLVSSTGFHSSLPRRASMSAATGTRAAYVLSTQKPVVVENLGTETRFAREKLLLDNGVVSGVSLIIEGPEQPFGMLGAHSRKERDFNADEVNFLVAISNLVSAAVDRHHEEELSRHAALHDPLTGLPNRTLALDHLALALGRRQRHDVSVAALMLDLDRFKVINDSLGHAAGDELLLALAARLRDSLRPGDTIARLGGDEFVVICEVAGGTFEIIALAERMAAAVCRPFGLKSGDHFVSASIGIAVSMTTEDTPESLIRDADAAMYRAKQRGPGRHELFDATMRSQVLRRLQTEIELRRALEREELRVYFQPIFDLVSGNPFAIEALVRWEHPRHGLLPPLRFIPIAEETGLIAELGRRVLEQACRRGAEFQQRFGIPLQVYVNTSGRQIENPLFPEEVAGINENSELLPGTLKLEVTESVLIEGTDASTTVLLKLHEQGLGLVLDDFGTGYSSLSQLKQFPLDAIKIDRSFTDRLASNDQDRAIVKAVIEMSRALDISVVAEGVETEAQLQQLRLLGCEQVQGYLLCRPLPAADIATFLGERFPVTATQ